MKPSLKASICGTIGAVAVFAVRLTAGSPPVAVASDAMPVAEQNALVKKHCAVCHTDATRDGGLSLEHFDAAQAPPSLTAMMLSKLTSGIPIETVKAAAADASAKALLVKNLNTGAIRAAGVPVADMAAIERLSAAFAAQASGASEWHVTRDEDRKTKSPEIIASIMRELPTRQTGAAESYRLVLACNSATRQGTMQLTWAPVDKTGTLTASVDDGSPVTYEVKPIGRKMGNGSGNAGSAAIALQESRSDSETPRFSFPARTLTISDLFPNETVLFPFESLDKSARQALSTCFPESSASR